MPKIAAGSIAVDRRLLADDLGIGFSELGGFVLLEPGCVPGACDSSVRLFQISDLG